jgi:thiosulfate/3-mercaptopyruvate sulfurtransferase
MSHVPGAVYLAEKTLRSPLRGLPAQILAPEMVAGLFGRVGIDNTKPVVVYTAKGGFKGWGDGLDQFMVAYTLARMNHGEVYMLDGGLDKWTKEGRGTNQTFPDVKPSKFQAKVNREMFIELEDLMMIKDNPETILLDARPTQFYTGETGPWIRNGHIPDAVSLPWAQLMDSANKTLLKPYDDIEEMVELAGATRDKLVICSCGTGREATNEYAIIKHLLGYPRVMLYEGSFTEWSAHPELEVVKGSKPR